MLIYVSHPYGGLQENKIKVEQIIRKLALEDSENVYISPIHTFGFMYSDVAYSVGLNWCIKLLGRCDKMIVFGNWDESEGCLLEIHHCKQNGIEVIYDNIYQ